MTDEPPRHRTRALVWGTTAAIVVADAAVATPLGLSLLLVVPLSIAAYRLARAELVALTVVCTAARVLFGPIGDPLDLRGVTLHVPERVQVWFSAMASVIAYGVIASTFRVIGVQRRRIDRLAQLSETDPLTGAANRRALEAALEAQKGCPASALVVDADHFKAVNDDHGHDMGDRVLKELVARLRAAVRSGDLVARVGGEEFVVLLPGAPPAVGLRVAERVLALVRQGPMPIGDGRELPVTVSIGCAAGPLDAALLAAADAALYEAKRAGRDRVVCAP